MTVDTSTLAGILAASRQKSSVNGSMAGEAARNGTAPATTGGWGNSNVTPSPTPSDNTTSTDVLQTIMNNLANNSYTKTAFPVQFNKPTQSAAQRAAARVNPLYSGKTAALNAQQGVLDRNLAVGQATQRNYGQIGDAKLAEIYNNLTQTAQGVADKTQQTYADAKTGVQNSYADAAKNLQAVGDQSMQGLSKEAQALGLGDALQTSQAALKTTMAQDSARMSVDQANSIANIVTLGANMGAAALQQVNIEATLGANSRKDLVNTVQNALLQLQQDHDNQSSVLQAQLADLESQRAQALQDAQSQFEADDADKEYQYSLAAAQWDAQQQQAEIAFQHQNLQDMLDILKQQDDASNNAASRTLAQRAADLADNKFAQDQLNDSRNYEIATGNLTLDAAKLSQQQQNDQYDQWYKSQKLSLDTSIASVNAKNAAAKLYIDNQRLGLDAAKMQQADDQFWANFKQTGDINEATNAAKVKVAEINQATKQIPTPNTPEEKAKIAAQTQQALATIDKLKAQTKAIQDKQSAAQTAKYAKGMPGYVAFTNDNKGIATKVQDIVQAVNNDKRRFTTNAYDLALLIASEQSSGTGSVGAGNTLGAAGGAADPKLLQALYYWYNK